MSRPKVRTAEADQIIREEARRRVEFRSNKQIAQILEAKGVKLSPYYIGELVKQAERRIREEYELSRRAKVMRGMS